MTIVFKIIFTIILGFFDFFSIVEENYFILINLFIYLVVIYSLYIAEDRLNFCLKLVYIIIFWLIISDIYSFLNLFYFNTILSSHPKGRCLLLLSVSVFSGYLFDSLDFLDYSNQSLPSELTPKNFTPVLPQGPQETTGPKGPQDPSGPFLPAALLKKGTELRLHTQGDGEQPQFSPSGLGGLGMSGLQGEEEGRGVEENPLNSVTPEKLRSKIEIMDGAIKIEINKTGGKGPNNPEELMSFIRASSFLPEEKINKLLELLKTNGNDYKEIYKNIPRFNNYNYGLSSIYVLNNNVYLSETYDNVMSFKDKSNFVFNPSLAEVTGGNKFFFFISISELLQGTELKDKIDIQNKKIIPMDKNKCSDEWDLFKKYWYIWFIEMNPSYYLKFNIWAKGIMHISEITPIKFMLAMFQSSFDFSEEWDLLVKAKIWYEHHKGIKPSSLPESTLYEYREIFIKFWVNQISWFNTPEQLNSDYYNVNMYDINNVYEELLENILFSQCKVLEAYWTINKLNKLISLNPDAKEVGGIETLNTESKRIDFFNKLYEQLKIEIIVKYKDVYDLRRQFIIDRCSRVNYEEFLIAYERVKLLNSVINFDSKINKENLNKNPLYLPQNKNN